MRRAYAGLLLGLLGCDPTRGLADSADAALPDVKRYFDGAGTQLTSGPWSRVVIDLDVDTLYHVAGRRLDDKQPTFHLFGADARDGCAVAPNAGTWLMGKPPDAPFRVLPYLESIDDNGRGRLRFTTVDCQVQDLAVEDAGRPYPRLYDRGYLVPTKSGYTFADPWTGDTREIAANLQGVLVWSDAVLFWADDELKSFSEQFEAGSEWGNKPAAILNLVQPPTDTTKPAQVTYLVEDADGLHHVTFDHDTLAISSEDVLNDACHLQSSPVFSSDGKGAFVTLQQPCGNPKPTVLHLDTTTFETLDSFELPFEADARQTRAIASAAAIDGTPLPLSVVYLTDVDDSGRGTLYGWQAGMTAPIQLGDHADLDTASLETPGGDWDGIAQVNYQTLGDYLAHDLIHFRWDGTTENIAQRLIRNSTSGELMVNFDGVAGDLALFDFSDDYRVIAKGVPPYSTEARSYIGDHHYARVDRYDGTSGRLLLGTTENDPASWDAVGKAVQPDSTRFAWFMPALLFIENWDPDSNSGSLVAYNYDLDARTTIAEGVSSFDLTTYPWDGIVYSIPRGKKQGIWFSKAK